MGPAPGERILIAVPLNLRQLVRSDSPYYRASFFICLGSLAMAVSGLLDLAHRLGAGGQDGLLQGYLPISIWTAALVLLAIGFLWIGTTAEFSRAAFWVALLHLAQAANILWIVIIQGRSAFAPDSLTVGRMLTLLVFVLADRSRLPRGLRFLLAGGALLQMGKVVLRSAHFLPTDDPYWLTGLDVGLALGLAAALFWIGSSLLDREREWEQQQAPEEAMGLAEFNNPEHPWNKSPRDRNPV